MSEKIEVSVAFALPDDSFWQNMTVAVGTTARQAVEQSGVLERFAQLDPEALRLGIYALPVKPDQVLVEGDRVEIYRALLVDPKTVPRKAKSKAASKAKSTAKS